ncbi:MAG TPA: phosphotransferase [Acidimicrobiia bacterium]|nr:phosphotransferase [Acidimicrobiia bacterium]
MKPRTTFASEACIIQQMTSDLPPLHDPDLPAVEILLGSEARGPLEAVTAATGATVGSFRPRQVTWWPGRSITVRYTLQSEDGTPLPQVIVTAGSIPSGAARLEADDVTLGAWALPNDPGLPGLASVLDPRTIRPMLSDLGIQAERVAVQLRAYRPARRAVVQVDTERSRIFVKLGKPDAIRRLHDTHRLLAETLPVPDSLGYDPELGILVMPAGRGETLRHTLDLAGPVPEPPNLDALIRDLPAPLPGGKSRSPIGKLGSLVDLLRRLVPDQSDRLDSLVGGIGEDPDSARIPVHGDYHDGQLLVEEGVVTGLLDVDTHSLGHPADDPATMLGHLRSRAPHSPEPARVVGFAADLERLWADRLDRSDLTRRTAAVMLGLATGPFRVQADDWPAQVRRRIANAEVAFHA